MRKAIQIAEMQVRIDRLETELSKLWLLIDKAATPKQQRVPYGAGKLTGLGANHRKVLGVYASRKHGFTAREALTKAGYSKPNERTGIVTVLRRAGYLRASGTVRNGKVYLITEEGMAWLASSEVTA
jgi:hypothetical protein